MSQKNIDKMVDALIKLTQACEKAISILVANLPAKEDFDVLTRDENYGPKEKRDDNFRTSK